MRSIAATVIASTLLLAGCESVPAGSAPPAPSTAPNSAGYPAQTVRPAANVGRLQAVQWPLLLIDRKELRAAPGARIVGSNNLTITPNMLPPNARVEYELDGTGQVRLLKLLGSGDEVRVPGAPRPVAPPVR